uniref:Doublecortin domain-containing protein n=1 Tax=Rhabditophanes sp. KR3021 TaxID=114890 RepID=A0AC35U1S9_9BILA
MESSPSIATLKLRKEPFLNIEYVIQVPAYGSKVVYKDFPLGAQNIVEGNDEREYMIGGPFTYIPQYPTLANADEMVELTQVPDDTPTHLILEVPQMEKRETLSEIKEESEPVSATHTETVVEKDDHDNIKEIKTTTTETITHGPEGETITTKKVLVETNEHIKIDSSEGSPDRDNTRSPIVEITPEQYTPEGDDANKVEPTVEEPEDDSRVHSDESRGQSDDNNSSIMDVVIEGENEQEENDETKTVENIYVDEEGNHQPVTNVEKTTETETIIDEDGNTRTITIEKVTSTTTTGNITAEEAKQIFDEMTNENTPNHQNSQTKTVETFEEVDEDGNTRIVVQETTNTSTHMVSTATKPTSNGQIDVSTTTIHEN